MMKISVVLGLSLLLLPGVSVFAGEIQVLCEEAMPASFYKEGVLTGFNVEIVREMLKRMNLPDKIQVYPWARAYMMLQTKPDIALMGTTRTEEREQQFKWVGPIYTTKWAFYAQKGTPIQIFSLQDAKKVKRIGTYINDVREQFLIKEGFTNLESTINNVLNLKKLQAGRIDLMVGGSLSMPLLYAEANVPPEDVVEVFVIKEGVGYIAFSKDTSDEVVKAFADTLSGMRKDGTFQKIYTSFLPNETPPE